MTGRIDAVVFDLDGVLIDSEVIWSEVRERFVEAEGGTWVPGAQERMMGMATQEWSAYLHDELGVGLPPDEIARRVIDEMAARYRERLPWLPGAQEAVHRLARRWPLGLASSSPARLIRAVLAASGLDAVFRAVLSTEEVGVGKPAPDVYLAVVRRLGVAPERAAAVEDSTNGLRAARAAGMRVIAAPNPAYPPDGDELRRADAVVRSLDELTDAVVDPSLDATA